MTTVSLHKEPGDAKLSTADKQPLYNGPWRTVFRLSAIVGWSAMVTFGVTAMVGEMFAAVTLLTISASAFAAAGLAATFLPSPFTGYPFVTQADLRTFHGDHPKAPESPPVIPQQRAETTT